jgi:CheY-like chemotaxis protein
MKTTDIQDVKRSLVPLTLILCVGQDPALLKTRNLILRAQGYIVESELSVNQAITHFMASDFDLVLLCHSLPAKDRDRLTCLIRASGSRIPVVSISSSASHDLAKASIGCGPEELLKGVKEVLAKAAQTLQERQSSLALKLPSRRHSLGYCLSQASKYEWPPSSRVFFFCYLLWAWSPIWAS